jgi:NAD(P)-dependent dehydrogenase (short-subunit alcohol dehydrogenase family)
MMNMKTNDPLSVPQLFDLTGRTALVTGGSGHLGTAISSALAEAGARVIIAGRTLEKGLRTAERLKGPEATRHAAVAIDHMDEVSIDEGFSAATEIGNIDILFNNGHEPVADDWSTVTGPQFDRQLKNLTGYFLLARKVRDSAVQRHAAASIIMLGSMYGMVGSYPEAYEGLVPASPAAYHALKGGVVHLTRHLAVYWAKDQIRVNCLSPGPFPSASVNSELVQRLEKRSPMGRMGRADELRGAALFLASDASSYVTGHNLLVDGGWTAW